MHCPYDAVVIDGAFNPQRRFSSFPFFPVSGRRRRRVVCSFSVEACIAVATVALEVHAKSFIKSHRRMKLKSKKKRLREAPTRKVKRPDDVIT